MPKAANPFDYSTIADVQLSIDYTALDSPDYRLQVIQQFGPVSKRRSGLQLSATVSRCLVRVEQSEPVLNAIQRAIPISDVGFSNEPGESEYRAIADLFHSGRWSELSASSNPAVHTDGSEHIYSHSTRRSGHVDRQRAPDLRLQHMKRQRQRLDTHSGRRHSRDLDAYITEPSRVFSERFSKRADPRFSVCYYLQRQHSGMAVLSR